MGIIPITTGTLGGAAFPQKKAGFLAVGERMLKVEIGQRRADEMQSPGFMRTLKKLMRPEDEAYFVNKAEKGIKKDVKWRKEYEGRMTVMKKCAALFGDEHPKLPFLIKNIQNLDAITAARKYPMVQARIAEMKQTTDEKKLLEQSESLGRLLNLILVVSENEEDGLILERITDCEPTIEGFKEAIKAEREASKRELKTLEERRKTSAVSTKAIVQQAGLFEAIRQGKAWAKKQGWLDSQGGSANKVYRLYRENEPIIAAYYKVGRHGEEATGKMEKLIWDISQILGLEEFFVATGVTNILKARGGIQPAQEGTILLTSSKKLQRQEVLNGILVSIVFGMFDAHSSNIFITKENKIKFFDNSRSMTHSNDYINRSFGIAPAYRCALLDLPQAKEDLQPQEIAALKEKLKDIEGKLPQLKRFLAANKTALQKLPPGWLDADRAFTAMEERLKGIRKEVETRPVMKAEDLANPEYRFAFASSYLNARLNKESLRIKSPHNLVGGLYLDSIWKTLTSKGYDLSLLKSWSDTLSFDALARKIEADFAQLKTGSADNKAFMETRAKQAALDLKDIPRKDCVTSVHQMNLEALQAEPGLRMAKMTRNEALRTYEKEKLSFMIFTEEGKPYLIHKAPPVVEEIDLSSVSGKVKIGAREVPIEGLVLQLKE